MKRLLWSVSLACFLPVAAEMPSHAAGPLDIVTEPSTNLAGKKTNAFTDTTAANVSVDPFANAKTFAPTVKTAKVAESNPFDSFAQPVAPLDVAIPNTDNNFVAPPIQVAGTPAKKPAALKVATPANTELQPAQADNNPLLSQNAPSTTDLDRQLGDLNNQKFPVTAPGGSGFSVSPAMSINNPVGFGADNGIGFLSGSYQSGTRLNNPKSDGELGLGVGLFDATESVGLELSYTINSFGSSQGFGSGGFNAKLHKRFGDGAVAIGWNRFANITFGNTGVASDYPKNSYYAVGTQVIRTTEDVDSFLSRISLSAGVGGGQFLSYATTSTNPNPSGVNVFGSAAFRLAKPVSAIVEWTGQDLAAGLSLTPFGDSFPLVITPAFRDISGINGQSARFVLGVGTAFKF
jgi:hypothetical protein